MSLLGTPVYANPSTPLWVSAGGGAISGNITTTGSVTAQSGMNTWDPNGYAVLNTTGGFVQSQFTHASGNTLIKSADPIIFTKVGAVTGNTSLTTSTAGVNADVLAVGGSIQQKDQAGATGMVIYSQSNASYLQSAYPILFTKIAAGTGDSSLTIGTAGTNTDNLTIGGTVSARNLDLLDTTAAAVIGTATLSSGTVVVNTTACDVTSYIILTRTGVGASTALGELRVSNQGANNFTVVSAQPGSPTTTEAGDESTFHWMIINAA